MQQINVASLIGDDGIVATPEDAVLFLRGLMEGKLIAMNTLEFMKIGLRNSAGVVDYGLGLDHAHFGDKIAFGHSGGGLGAGCQLYYFPHNNTYYFIGINLGTITESPIHQQALPALNRILYILAE